MQQQPDLSNFIEMRSHADTLHDLRDQLNTIQSSAALLQRVANIDAAHQKYLAWILEKAEKATKLVNDLSNEE